MRESSTPNTEDDFVVLLEELRDGLRTVEEFLEAVGFESWLRICVYGYDFRCFDGWFGSEDLRQLCREKVRKSESRLTTANTPNIQAFRRWVWTLVRHTFLDQVRTHKRPKNNGLSRSYAPVEIIDIRTPDMDYERKELYECFMAFIKDFPEAHRFAVLLWLQGESLRNIAAALNERDITCSHVAVNLWISEILDEFKVRLGLKPPKKPRRRRG